MTWALTAQKEVQDRAGFLNVVAQLWDQGILQVTVVTYREWQ